MYTALASSLGSLNSVGRAVEAFVFFCPRQGHFVVSGHRPLVSHWPQRKELI